MKSVCVVLVVLLSLLPSKASAANISVGQSCVLSSEVQISSRRKGVGTKIVLSSGAIARVMATWQGEYRVDSERKTGWVSIVLFDQVCVISPKAPQL